MKKIHKSFFFMSMIDNIIPVSIALTGTILLLLMHLTVVIGLAHLSIWRSSTYQLFKIFDFDFLYLQGIPSQNGSFQVTNSAVLLQRTYYEGKLLLNKWTFVTDVDVWKSKKFDFNLLKQVLNLNHY